MMNDSGVRNVRNPSGPRRAKGPKADAPQQYGNYGYGQAPQLFDDTSMQYPQSQFNQNLSQAPPNWNMQGYEQAAIFGQQLFNNPMAAMTMNTLADQGKTLVNEKFEKYVSVSKLKYYFAVDTAYVAKKLGLLFFPFTHNDWTVHYNQDEPVAPRYDVNAPDLYIPSMAFVTYILTAGFVLGSQNRFTPEQLGMHASSALGWLLVEIALILLSLYLLSASSLKMIDLVAFCSYKYVCMVAALLACVGFKIVGYYAVLGYCSISLGVFLVRTLRVLVLPKTTADRYAGGSRRNSYILLAICVIQPAVMYWLTHHLVTYTPPDKPI